ncbi:protein of unknown function UPF0153 [Olavius sp. associated proteobacterium Delta 1]|nr:protein of unknown function UPF0153 [Olavius sp. associated proteobacterium Delta 1]
MPDPKNIPAGEDRRYLLGDGKFRFACHSGVACFTRCCHNADMYLYPYDIIRLKQRRGLTSEEFLTQHTITAMRENPYFPNVMLKMSDLKDSPCSFLLKNGCTVYEDRPYSCRAYPLEPAFYGDGENQLNIRCYVARHGHCLGHRQGRQWTAHQWMADQQMDDYHEINAGWARLDSLFRQNPFGEKGLDNPALKMAYMASYNMDTFRRFVFDSSFLSRFHVPQERLEDVRESDSALLLLGFDWILRFLFGQGRLRAI